jgi:hypothetical protein
VEYDAICRFENFDYGAGVVAGSLDNCYAFFDYDAGIGCVVRGIEGGEESEVYAELEE